MRAGCNSYRVFLFLLFSGCSVCALSQSLANYTISRSTGNVYSSIIGTGNAFASWRYSGTFSEDDNRSDLTDIGFDFWYNGQRYTQFSVSTNGYIDFSSSANDGGPQCNAYGYCNTFFSASTSGTWLALAPFYDDMTTRSGSDPLGNSIKYQVSGTAPFRTLTVEWDGMAVYQNTSPDLNFQVRIYETTGVIEFNYETMNRGTVNFSYTLGINSTALGNPPTASQLRTQQTENSTSFSNTVQNNLSAMPLAFSRIQFTPSVPTAASGSLTLSGISSTSMNLSWPNWATNEIGYVLQYSTDGTNYFFYSQTPANSTSTTATGLLPATTYYWRVSAVTEGTLGTALIANATTQAAGTVTSIRSGFWDATSTWDCACVPSLGDNVQIRNTHVVTLRTALMQCNNLTVGEGVSGSVSFSGNTSLTLQINGRLAINTGASLTQATNSNATHSLNLNGDVSNSGTLNLSVDGNSLCNAIFRNPTTNQTVTGGGANTFHTLTIDKGTKSNILEIASSNFVCNADALIFGSGGTFKFSSSGTNSFGLFSTTRDIPINGGIWMNSAASTMSFGASINLRGDLRIDQGNVVVGNAANENILSFGGTLEINGGSLSIAGRFVPSDPQSISRFVQTGGTVTLPTVSSTSTTLHPFDMTVVGSSFTMSGGTIILQREGGGGAQNLGFSTMGVTSNSVTGGTLQIGNTSTPAGQTCQIISGTSLGNLLLNSVNATAQLASVDLDLLGNVTLTSGTLNDNGRTISLAGNWLVTSGQYTANALGTVTFNGTKQQSITTAGRAFNNLTLSGSDLKLFQDNLTVNGNFTSTSIFSPVNSGFVFTLTGNFTNNGTYQRRNETLNLTGTSTQNISGSSLTEFTNLTINKTSGSVTLNGTVNLYGVLNILSSTNFDADGTGAGVLTLISTNDAPVSDARIARLTGTASITGNVTVQRFTMPEIIGGTRVYRYISAPVSGQFVSDWIDDFPITGTFSNPSTDFPLGSGITTICGIPIVPTTPSLFVYVEANAGTGANDLGWTRFPASGLASSASLQVGRGYAAFLRDCTNPTVIDVRGPVNQGTINLTSLVSRTVNGNTEDGYNLVGNPYPSAIDWEVDAGWTRTGISSVIAVRDNGSGGGYVYYDYSSGSTPLPIAMGQAFWVRVTGTPTFSINEQAKTGTAATFFRTGEPDRLTLLLVKGTQEDKAIVNINPNAKTTLDDFDGPKLDNTLFDLSTLSEEGVSLAINAIDHIACGSILPINVKDLTTGSYTLSVEGLGIFSDQRMMLFDRYTNTLVDVNSNTAYDFVVTTVAGSKASDRFEIRFDNTPQILDLSLTVSTSKDICKNEPGAIAILNSQAGVGYGAQLQGRNLSESISGNGGTITLIIPFSELPVGANEIDVVATPGCGPSKVLLTKPIITRSEYLLPLVNEPPVVCQKGTVLLSVTNSEVPLVQPNWYTSQDASNSIANTYQFTTPEIISSQTYFVSLTNSAGCEGPRLPVEVKVENFVAPVIVQAGNILRSNYPNGNQWFRDGVLLEGSSGPEIIVTTSGVYSLVVQTTAHCFSEAQLPYFVTDTADEFQESISVYPNPVSSILNIRVDKNYRDKMILRDVMGRFVQYIFLQELEDCKSAAVALGNLPDGVYLLEGVYFGQTKQLKIVKTSK